MIRGRLRAHEGWLAKWRSGQALSKQGMGKLGFEGGRHAQAVLVPHGCCNKSPQAATIAFGTEMLLSQFRKPEVPSQGVSRVVLSLKALGEERHPSLPLFQLLVDTNILWSVAE